MEGCESCDCRGQKDFGYGDRARLAPARIMDGAWPIFTSCLLYLLSIGMENEDIFGFVIYAVLLNGYQTCQMGKLEAHAHK